MGAVIEWTPPAAREIAALSALLEPWRRITAPVFHGVERLPAGGPVLFVGNHTVYGMLDMPLMILELQRHGFWVRGLADRLHYAIPGWRELLTRFGAVPPGRTFVDAESPVMAPVQFLVDRFAGGRTDAIWPISRGLGPTPLPRPERLYSAFGEPIDTSPWAVSPTRLRRATYGIWPGSR